MREILRTNDEVLLGFVESLFRDAGINAVVLDRNMSLMEGSIGMLPRRLLVDEEQFEAAADVMRGAELGQWIFKT